MTRSAGLTALEKAPYSAMNSACSDCPMSKGRKRNLSTKLIFIPETNANLRPSMILAAEVQYLSRNLRCCAYSLQRRFGGNGWRLFTRKRSTFRSFPLRISRFAWPEPAPEFSGTGTPFIRYAVSFDGSMCTRSVVMGAVRIE